MSDQLEPVSAREFASAMAAQGLARDGFSCSSPVHVAVSGGVDSMCLAFLARDWLKKPGTLRALVVDHGLRPNSTREARLTADFLEEKSIPARILTWQHGEIVTGVEARAREARYSLLQNAMTGDGKTLLLGHHMNDRIETFLMRLERGSGLKGLAGMSAVSRFRDGSAEIHRPLSAFPKARLAATLQKAGWQFVEDQSNADTRFRRNWFRRHMAYIGDSGLSPDRLAGTIHLFGKLRCLVERRAVEFIDNRVQLDPAGWGKTGHDALLALSEPVRQEVLLRIMNLYCRAGGERPDLKHAGMLATSGGSQGHVIFRISGGTLWFFCCRRGAAGHKDQVFDRVFDRRFDMGFFDEKLHQPAYLGDLRAQKYAARINAHVGWTGSARVPSFVLASLPCLESLQDPAAFMLPATGFSSAGNHVDPLSSAGKLIKSCADRSIFKVV